MNNLVCTPHVHTDSKPFSGIAALTAHLDYTPYLIRVSSMSSPLITAKPRRNSVSLSVPNLVHDQHAQVREKDKLRLFKV